MDLYIDYPRCMLSHWDFSIFALFNGCVSLFECGLTSVSFPKAESFAQGKMHPEQTTCRV